MSQPAVITTEQAMSQAASLYGAGRLAEAWRLCGAILQADPRHFWALHLAATIALRNDDAERAITLGNLAHEVDPRNAEVLGNRGAALRRLDRLHEALADYDLALALAPNAAAIHVNRGIALAAMNRHDEAIAAFDNATRIDAGHLPARFHRALSRLVLGDFAGGLEDYEARFGVEGRAPRREFAQPQWMGGEPLAGKTLLVHAEQGLGDALQCVRYAPLLERRGARVIFEVQAPIRDLVGSVTGVHAAIAVGDALPAFDFHLPLMSLPLAMGTRPSTIPSGAPYIAAEPHRIDAWRARLPKGDAVRIGIAWSGNARHVNDRNRSMPLQALAPLRELGATIVALQKDVTEADRAQLREWGWLSFGDDVVDFRDTAALAASMDMVASVDTAIAHLAGAMGRPLRVLLPYSPDCRWLLQRDDSPWYPSAKLLRQATPGDWRGVVARLVAEVPRPA